MIKLVGVILILTIVACNESKTEIVFSEIGLQEVELSSNSLNQEGATLKFKNLPFNGFVVSYWPNGNVRSKTGYLNGKREGESNIRNEDGKLLELRFYKSNKKVNKHEGWWPNGNKKFEYTFVDGFHHGAFLEWQNDGKPYKVFNYEMGQEIGAQKMWDSDGGIRANYVVKNGHRYGLIGLKNCKSVSDEKGVLSAVAY